MKIGKRRKVLVIAGIAVVVISALALIAASYIKSQANRIIGNEFERITDGRYRLAVGDVKVNLLRRSLTLTDIDLIPANARPDTAVGMPRYVFDFSARQLIAAGIRFTDEGGIEIKRLRLTAPKVKVHKLSGIQPPTDSAKRVKPLRIGIGQIIISEGYAQLQDGDTISNVIEGFEFSTRRLFVDTGAGLSSSTLGNDMKLTIAKFSHLTEDQSVRIELDSLAVEMAAKTLRVGSFAATPTYSKEEFGWKSWGHKDWTQARISDISCSGVDYCRLIDSGELIIDSMRLGNGEFASYKNRNITRKEWVKPLYHQLIQRLPVRFAVRKSVIGNIDAQYEELKAGGDKPGIIAFNGIGGEIDGLSNIPPPDRDYSEWRLRARVMDAGALTVAWFMPIDSLNDRFELMAILGRMDIAHFNKMLTPLANVQIKAGVVDKVDFHITGDSRRSEIDMTMLYDGLEVALLKKKNGRIKEKQFATGIVNSMILLDSNPMHGETRTARQTAQRDPYRSPWNYLWRTVFAGMKETIGLGEF